jgi:hypothetical protein
VIQVEGESAAKREEIRIKRLTRAQKLAVVRANPAGPEHLGTNGPGRDRLERSRR